MGMDERALASSSARWTCLRMVTKCDESFSAASGERRGAQRLYNSVSDCFLVCPVNGKYIRAAITDVSLHRVHRDISFDLFLDASTTHMHAHNMSCDTLVTTALVVIPNNEDHVKTGQNGGLEVNVFSWCFQIIISPEDRVCGGQHRCPRVEDRGNTSLGNGDSLLLHGFVNGNPVLVSHLVELINTDSTAVCKNHGTSFKVELTRGCISLYGRCQTSRR